MRCWLVSHQLQMQGKTTLILFTLRHKEPPAIHWNNRTHIRIKRIKISTPWRKCYIKCIFWMCWVQPISVLSVNRRCWMTQTDVDVRWTQRRLWSAVWRTRRSDGQNKVKSSERKSAGKLLTINFSSLIIVPKERNKNARQNCLAKL